MLLVGIENSAATLENGLAAPQKIDLRVSYYVTYKLYFQVLTQ